MLADVMRKPVQPQKALESLIETTDILQRAVEARDKEKTFEAVTVLLMQFLNTFGAGDGAFLKKTFPVLEHLKDDIQAGHFDDVLAYVLAFEAKFRAVLQNLAKNAGPRNSG